MRIMMLSRLVVLCLLYSINAENAPPLMMKMKSKEGDEKKTKLWRCFVFLALVQLCNKEIILSFRCFLD